jgi:adenosylmethionine-8-amino-7-oxononanoate aminotransferase
MKSKNLKKTAADFYLRKPSILYPNRPLQYGAFVDTIVRGKNSYIYDSNNKKYLDANSGLWNVTLGYSNLSIIKAIEKQSKALPFVSLISFSNPVVVGLAEKLLSITSKRFERVLLTCSGSESIEAAIKIVRKISRIRGSTTKFQVATFELSYHGTSYGAMSASGIDRQLSEDYEPKVPGFVTLPSPFCKCCPCEKMAPQCRVEIANSLNSFFSQHGASLAAVLAEPILGSGGVLPLHKEYILQLHQLCQKNQVLLVFDEVATGFGRSGKFFCFQKLGIVPDILCLGKGINSGYLPLAALLISGEICDTLKEAGAFIDHFSTQNGNPIACASGLAAIDFIEKKKLIPRVEEAGIKLKSNLKKSLKGNPAVFEIRGQGLMIGIELVHDKEKRVPYSPHEILEIEIGLRRKGLIVYPFFSPINSGISLFPTLIITDKQAEWITDKIVEQLSSEKID